MKRSPSLDISLPGLTMSFSPIIFYSLLRPIVAKRQVTEFDIDSEYCELTLIIRFKLQKLTRL